MSEVYKNSIARIVREPNKQPIGAGVLVGPRQVLTCAHVMNSALGRSQLAEEPPPAESRVTLDFPLPAPGVFLTAKVAKWEAPQADGSGDMALLELESPPPDHTAPAQFTNPGDVWGHPFRAFGFPDHHIQGRDASGVLRGRNAIQRLMMEQSNSAQNFALPGFSGTGVWDETLGALIGITVLGEYGKPQMSAFLIPTDQLQAFWSDLPVAQTQEYAASKPTDFKYHVFISYTRADEVWVEETLLPKLEGAGLNIFVEFRDIQPGASRVDEIQRAVVESAKTLVVLTPDYLKDEWAVFGNVMTKNLDPAARQTRLIPLMKTRCDPPLYISHLTYVDFTRPERQQIAWKQLLTALGAQEKLSQGENVLQLPVQTQKDLYHLVPRNFGIDSRSCRQVGFRIEENVKDLDARLEMFWFSGHKQPDEMKLDYPLNVSSHLLKKTADGQFILAIAHPITNGYSLTMNDGYYGLPNLAGYYKIRVSTLSSQQNKVCFDILLHYKGRDAISIEAINEIGCDDLLDHILERDVWSNESIRNWSTVSFFQPNSMYRNPIMPQPEIVMSIGVTNSDLTGTTKSPFPNIIGELGCKVERWTTYLEPKRTINHSYSDVEPQFSSSKPKRTIIPGDTVERYFVKFENRRVEDREVVEAENVLARVSFYDDECIEIQHHDRPMWKSKNLNEKPKARVNIAPDDFEQLYTVIRKVETKELYVFCRDSYPQGELEPFREELRLKHKLRYIRVVLSARNMEKESYWITLVSQGKNSPLEFQIIDDPCSSKE